MSKTLEKFIKDCEFKLKANIPAYMNTMEVGWILMNLTAIKEEIDPKWISIKQMNLEHLQEGDAVLTLDQNGNMVPYKFFLGGLNMIGEHKDDNRKITHWIPLPK